MKQTELNEHNSKIDNEEIAELEARIRELQLEVDYMKKVGKFSKYCPVSPYSGIKFERNRASRMPDGVIDYKPVVTIHKGKVWEALNIAVKKLFFEEDLEHIESLGKDGDYWIKHRLTTGVNNNCDLSLQQQKIAVSFLNDAIKLFNEYFVRANGELSIDGVRYVLDTETGRYIRESEGID